jgi:hypothetical protein
MILEERNYTFHPGKVPLFLKMYEAEGLAIHTRHLGRLVGFFTSEIGVLNQVVHMWAYEGMADREARRAKLYADPEWLVFLPKCADLIQQMENRILTSTSFSPLR